MKILMRNIGMTLHVIHKLRAQGIDNVQVNMDWQHLIMNGENLAEYAALLAAEGLLGHQHANSGWGTFDDDNMVGATAFMETLELAVELRRAGLRRERRAARLRPLPVHRGPGRRRSSARCCSGASSTGSRQRIDDAALREAQQRKDAVRAYELVYAALGAGGVSVAVGLDVGTSASRARRSPRTARCVGRAERGYALSTPKPGWAEQDPEDWWRGDRRPCSTSSAPTRAAGIGLSGQMHGLVALDADEARAAPGDPVERRAHAAPSARRSRSGSGSSG